MTNLEGNITLTVAPLYSLRNWIEYGFKQVKNELGWADYRLTDYASIERWWEIVMSTYLLVSIQAHYFHLETVQSPQSTTNKSGAFFSSTAQFSQYLRVGAGNNMEKCFKQLKVDYSTLHLLLFNQTLVATL